MNHHASSLRLAARVATIIVLFALGVDAAAAHGGHAHPENSGFDVTVLFQAGGAALAVGLAYLVASAIYRHRDAGRRDLDR